MKIRALLIDDEPLARKGINNLLDNYADIQVIGECEDGISAAEQIDKLKPDLVFLDIQMPEMDGFEVVSALDKNRLPLIIFITAYDEYAMQAFKIHAIDYLLKPLQDNLFNKAIERVRLIISGQQQVLYIQKTQSLLNDINKIKKNVQRFIVRESGKLIIVPLERIIWFGAEGDYVALHLEKEKHLLRDTLNHLEQQLDPSKFLRINRSTIIPIAQIKELQPIAKGDYHIVLEKGLRHTLSRTFREKVLETLKNSII